MFHSKTGVLFIIGFVDTSRIVPFMYMAIKFNFGFITLNNFVPDVLGLFLYCLAYCKQAALQHWHSTGLSSSDLAVHPIFRLEPHFCTPWNSHSTFYFPVLHVSLRYLWVFLCIPNNFHGSCGWNFFPPDHGLVSIETLIFHFLIQFIHCWLALSINWIPFYIHFLFYKFQIPSPTNPLIIFLLSSWLGTAQEWNMQKSVWSLEKGFLHKHYLQANRS